MKNAIVIAGSLALASLAAVVISATQPVAAERMTDQQFISAALAGKQIGSQHMASPTPKDRADNAASTSAHEPSAIL